MSAQILVSDFDYSTLRKKHIGAVVSGETLCKELDEYFDIIVEDCERQRIISMFFQQKSLFDAQADEPNDFLGVGF